jgi:predicted unusual protein kinase regulating ubiquinone biosynthesis (AarF/ABC1/UbiB family)
MGGMRAPLRAVLLAAGATAAGMLLAAGATAAGALVTAAVHRRASPGGPGARRLSAGGPGARPLSTTGRARRNLEVARLAGRTGRSYAATSARQVFASAPRRQQLRSDLQLHTAAEVAEALGSMKGALMKLGQMASYLDTGLPQAVRDTLATLQQDAPPMSAALAGEVLERELGAPPGRAFAEWDPEPIAAASIGQVHRAITHEGVAVAVKVQYPGVDDAIRADLDNSSALLHVVGLVFPGLDVRPLVDELRARLSEELDYRVEAANQRRFGALYAGHPVIRVPEVLTSLSTARVLTTALATGARYSEAQEWPAAERDLAGETIFRFVFGSIYRARAFNGDPHPGNYLFEPGGRVTFLDFGLVKWFEPPEVQLLADMVSSLVVRRDIAAFRRAVEAAGFLRPNPSLSDEQVAEYLGHYYELVLRPGRTTIDTDYASATVRHFFDASDEVVRRSNVPPAFAILQRINLGLYAVLGGLRATADWRRIAEELWPFVGAAPSTPIGRAEAEWRAETQRAGEAAPGARPAQRP